MKKIAFLILGSVLLAAASCTVDERSPSLSLQEQRGASYDEIDMLKDAIYHVGTGQYLFRQKDPYSLDNFKAALLNLTASCSCHDETKSQSLDFLSVPDLQATHYALKIYPRNEQEQWEIERMENVKVSYIPFNYVQFPEEAQILMSENNGCDSVNNEVSHYSVTYDGLMTVDGPLPSETYTMPILYVVWPCSMPFPEEYDYVVDYEVFIPQYDDVETKSQAGLSLDELKMLEEEAIELALGKKESEDNNSTKSNTFYRMLRGRIYNQDKLMTRLPLENLKLKFQLGSNIWETSTNSDGYFFIAAQIPLEASFIAVYNNPKWKITSEQYTSPVTHNFGTVENVWDGEFEIFRHIHSTSPHMEIHRAVNYYYNGEHSIRTWHYNDGIRLRAVPRKDDDRNGYFTYSLLNPAYITIYANNTQNQHLTIGTVLHELGHFTHYGERGGYRMFDKVHALIQESFASYVGFYLGKRYYASKGFVEPYANYNLTGQGRQAWEKNDGNEYSPLFVDLIDDYNQYENDINLPNDRINNVPHSLMREIAQEDYNWAECKSRLVSKIGVYYTEEELNDYILNYDIWFQNN